jgi:hypothetical protein
VQFQEKEHRKLSLPMADGLLAVSLGLLAAAKLGVRSANRIFILAA